LNLKKDSNSLLSSDFLFNTINSIYHTIENNPSLSKQLLLEFSEILRYYLHNLDSEYIALEEEICYLKKYINIEKIRKPELLINLNYSFIDKKIKIPSGSIFHIIKTLIEIAHNNLSTEVDIQLETENKNIININSTIVVIPDVEIFINEKLLEKNFNNKLVVTNCILEKGKKLSVSISFLLETDKITSVNI